MKKYDILGDHGENFIAERDDGQYVLATDADAEIARLTKERDDAEKQCAYEQRAANEIEQHYMPKLDRAVKALRDCVNTLDDAWTINSDRRNSIRLAKDALADIEGTP